MKEVKEICRSIIIFVVAMGVCILPTFLFTAEDEANILLRQPEYWGASAFFATIVTLKAEQNKNNSKK